MRPFRILGFGSRPSLTALTKLELLVVVSTIAVTTAILLPALAGAKAKHQPINCQARLKQIGLAFETWASDHSGRYPMRVPTSDGGTLESLDSGKIFVHFQVMSNELSTPKLLVCPNDKGRWYATNFSTGLDNSNLSYFVGLDATRMSGSSILCGDRNITNKSIPGSGIVILTTNTQFAWDKKLHSRKGFLCFADGSVRAVANRELPATVLLLGPATNRLAVP